ncbi:amino acid adenylation domain-containing protein [Vibrio sp. TRT 17S01]|uniref:amino acid adenylation domain-containing protein n=1 Tax=Vibrio sp. TRT 17S01 TaxID=3418505 RepID=UPI003CF03F7F
MSLSNNDFNLIDIQKDIWFDQKIDSKSSKYNIGGFVKFDSQVDLALLEQCIITFVGSHSIYQKSFYEDATGVPMVKDLPPKRFTIEQLNLKNEDNAVSWMSSQMDIPISLSSDVLFKHAFIVLDDGTTYWFCKHHHLIADGWSFLLLTRQVGELYNGKLKINGSDYFEYILDKQKYLNSDRYVKDADYWKNYLTTMPESAFSLKSNGIGKNNHSTFWLEKHNIEKIRHFCEAYKVSETHLFSAIVYSIISRFYWVDEVSIGYPVQNRTKKSHKGIVGPFVGMIPHIVAGCSGSKIGDLAGNIKSCLRTHYRHQQIPFTDIASTSDCQRSGLEIVDCIINYVPHNHSQFFGQANSNTYSIANPHSTVPLSVSIWDFGNHNGMQFDIVTNSSFVSDLEHKSISDAISVAISDLKIETKVAGLKLVSDDVLHTVLTKAKGSKLENTIDVVDRFISVRSSFKSELAVVDNAASCSLTYDDLDRRSSEIAVTLIEKHGPGNHYIGVCFENKCELIVAILGVLKAGYAYVPFDPEAPLNRLIYISKDARIVEILSDLSTLGGIEPSLFRKKYLNIKDNCQVRKEEDIAYVIYTSGSTGVPKGVKVSRSNLSGMIKGFDDSFPANVRSGLSLSPYFFDVSVWEMFSLLSIGGTVHFLAKENALRAESLVAHIATNHISQIYIPPNLLSEFVVAAEKLCTPLTLSRILIGVEPISHGLVERLFKLKPDLVVVNGYGPTEATICSTYYRCNSEPTDLPFIPIGTAVPGSSVLLVDRDQNIVPFGIRGEIVVVGAGVSEGYVTPDHGNSNRFGTDINEFIEGRFYKTGDLAEMLEDGNLYFNGRKDSQVKINGFRVDTLEIDSVIRNLDRVDDLRVVVNTNSETPFIEVFLVSHTSFDMRDIEEACLINLPVYMQPSKYTIIDEFPLTPNGKLDKSRLLELSTSEIKQTSEFNDIENVVKTVWEEVLDTNIPNKYIDFFALGGSSLKAANALSILKDRHRLSTEFSKAFKYRTIEKFSTQLQKIDGLDTIEGNESGESTLSLSQQRLWFLSQLDKASTAYNMHIPLTVSGDIDEIVLGQSLRALTQKHSQLRSVFKSDNEFPNLHVMEPFDPLIVKVFKDTLFHKQCNKILKELSTREFDLENGPLFEVYLFKKESRAESIILLCMHHIISDGWSIGLLLKDLSTLYNSLMKGDKVHDIEPKINYLNFSDWQRSAITDEVINKKADIWKAQLGQFPELSTFYTDRVRPAKQSMNGRVYFSRFDKELSSRLNKLAIDFESTPFVLLLSAFSVLLTKHNGQSENIIGTPVANRSQHRWEEVFGFFVNTLPIKASVDSTVSFQKYVEELSLVAYSSFDHQDVPFDFVVEKINPTRNVSYSPIFQVMFILQDGSSLKCDFGGRAANYYQNPYRQSKFDLTLSLTEINGEYLLDWEYATDLFDEATIRRLDQQFGILLDQLLLNPEAKLGDVQFFSEDDRKLLEYVNGTEFDLDLDSTILTGFSDSVASHGNAVAVAVDGESITYSDLDRRSSQLAAYLVESGLTKASVVALCLNRSIEMVVAILAIVKSGSTYLPLDPDFPTDRLRYMLNDSKAACVLTSEVLRANLFTDAHNVLLVNDALERSSEYSIEEINSLPASGDLAYLIYTSGSTGNPKGVMVSHRALNNFLCYMKEKLGIDADHKMLAVTTISFDISLLELLLPLISGACLCLAKKHEVVNPDDLERIIDDASINFMQATPSTWKMLLQNDWKPSNTFKALCGGEPLPLDVAESLSQYCKELWNVYGPTEATIWATMKKVDPANIRTNNIGTPLGNTKIHVLNERLTEVPVGIVGELCISGEALAEGYLNQEELTSSKFINVELSGKKTRVYKTGDLARWTLDGELECLGRNDDQVKVRGYRIELGEIESVLNAHELVKESAVVVQGEGDRKSIAAFVVPSEDGHTNESTNGNLWQSVWDDSYKEALIEVDSFTNISGWKSSYTGEMLPTSVMVDWLLNTVNMLKPYVSSAVLEIGCGTGMLLFKLLPQTDSYTGLDYSQSALEYIEAELGQVDCRSRVELHNMPADRIDELGVSRFNTIILNSVAQYFPNFQYLSSIIQKAINTAKKGGKIIIGDSRNYEWSLQFYISLVQVEDLKSLEEKQERLRKLIDEERELLYSPEALSKVINKSDRVSHIEFLLKTSTFENEMTNFRYDTVVHLDKAAFYVGEKSTCLWDKDIGNEQFDLDSSDGVKIVTNVPNGYVSSFPNSFSVDATIYSTPGDIALYISDKGNFSKILYESAERATVIVSGKPLDDVVFPELRPTFEAKTDQYNQPYQDIDFSLSREGILEWLRVSLPQYMVPSRIEFISDIPLTPNKKVDKKSLVEKGASVKEYQEVLSLTLTQSKLFEIWNSLLPSMVSSIEISFFESGGHSLSAMLLTNRIRKEFSIDISVGKIFEYPSIASQSSWIDDQLNQSLPLLNHNIDYSTLSLSQQNIWLLDDFENTENSYNMSALLHIRGIVNIQKLESALMFIVKKRKALRATIRSENSIPKYSFVEPYNPLRISDVNLPYTSVEDAQKLSEVSDAMNHQFVLSEGPLFRVDLVTFLNDESLLIVNVHHIISDGWSVNLLISELESLYNITADSESYVEDEEFLRFNHSQNQWLGSVRSNETIKFWVEALKSAPTLTTFPPTFVRPDIRESKGSRFTLKIEKGLAESIEKLCGDLKVTPFMFFLSALNILLYRHTLQRSQVIGSPIANRNMAESEHAVGMFVNLLPYAIEVHPDSSWIEVLENSKKVSSIVLENQELPFEKILEVTRPTRSLAFSPIVQTVLSFFPGGRSNLQLEGLQTELVRPSELKIKFDNHISISKLDSTQEYEIDWQFNSSLYSEQYIQSLGKQFVALCRSVTDDPHQKVESISFLTSRDLAIYRKRHNLNRIGKAPLNTVVDGFVKMAREVPDSIAVVCEDRKLTYSDLYSSAARVAKHLKSGLGNSKNVVAIHLDRSLESIVGLWGVLLSENAYMGIDVDFPKARIERMLKVVEPDFILTSIEYKELYKAFNKPIAIVEDIMFDETLTLDEINYSIDVNDPAYIIFTSGSTGLPKAVEVQHGAISNYTKAIKTNNYEHVGNYGLVTTIATDMCKTFIFSALTSGSTLHVLSKSIITDPFRLKVYLNDNRIDYLKTVPSHMSALVETKGLLAKCKHLMLGGEPLSKSLVRKLKSDYKNLSILNHYGPTETTVGMLTLNVDSMDEREISSSYPLGSTINGMSSVILGEKKEILPVGVIGEIYIAGHGVSLGYRNNTKATNDSFMEITVDCNRMRYYRSGDVGRLRSDGLIETLGRVDQQTKIRGYRIDLNDIESECERLPGVERAIAKITEHKDIELYILPGKEKLVISSVVSLMKKKLPAHMVPSSVTALDTIPLTHNGKVDKSKLKPVSSKIDSKTYEYATATEKKLAEIWSSLLKRKNISPSDDFFELGGHSLLAAQMVNRISDVFNIELPVTSLFQHTDICSLSKFIDSKSESSMIVERDSMLEFKHALSASQMRIWVLSQTKELSITYGTPSCLSIKGSIDVALLENALSIVVSNNEPLRSVFIETNGIVETRLSESSVNFELDSICREQGYLAKLDKFIDNNAGHEFDLKEGPLLRLQLVQIVESTGEVFESYLLYNLHHIVSDAWSVSIFTNELIDAYEKLVKGVANEVKDKSLYYQYVAWQHNFLQSKLYINQLNYWKHYISNPNSILELSVAKERPHYPSFEGKHFYSMIDSNRSKAFTTFLKDKRMTSFMGFATLFSSLLRVNVNDNLVTFGTPVSGRSKKSFEDLIGCFLNTLPLQIEVDLSMPLSYVLERVKNDSIGLLENQYVPFELLVEQLKVDRHASINPIYQTMLIMQNAPAISLNTDNLEIAEYRSGRNTSKLDLTLNVLERDGRFQLDWEYATDLFDEATIRRLDQQFGILLDQLLLNPEAKLGDVQFFSEDDRKLLEYVNGTEFDLDLDSTILTGFSDSVASHGNAVAVAVDGESITYSDLDRRSSQLAAYLVESGLTKASVVALCLNRSIEMVVAILAIVKSGSTYLPLDPDFPTDRLRYMLNDSKAACVLTSEVLRANLFTDAHNVLLVNDALERSSEYSIEEINSLPASGDLAYLIYTSGSTGNPKGVMVSHRALNNFLCYMKEKLGIDADHKMLAVTTISFDISLLELLLPLISGACLCLAKKHEVVNPDDLERIIDDASINFMQATPSTWKMLLQNDWKPSNTFKALCGGEPLPLDVAESLSQYCKELWNVYGPTEATIWATMKKVDPANIRTNNIGTPLGNTKIHVLNERLTEVPVGIVGELCISGEALAEGYLNQEELTSSKFINVELSGKKTRVYKTGDLARWTLDGELECLGRNDDQVKVRGYRIELGEIESVLNAHELVKESAVVVQGEGDRKSIAAFVVIKSDGLDVESQSSIENSLSVELPSYMIPKSLTTLEALPLTANGKIDKTTLKKATVIRPSLKQSVELTERHKEISEIWRMVLGHSLFTESDNFFDVGGNSVSIVQVKKEILSKLGFEIQIVDLFRHTSVHALVSLLDDRNKPIIKSQVTDSKLRKTKDRRQALMQRRRGK